MEDLKHKEVSLKDSVNLQTRLLQDRMSKMDQITAHCK